MSWKRLAQQTAELATSDMGVHSEPENMENNITYGELILVITKSS